MIDGCVVFQVPWLSEATYLSAARLRVVGSRPQTQRHVIGLFCYLSDVVLPGKSMTWQPFKLLTH
jgi:hypothetical protein